MRLKKPLTNRKIVLEMIVEQTKILAETQKRVTSSAHGKWKE